MLQKLFFGLAMLLSSPNFYSQAYKPILTDSCTWYVTSDFFGFSTNSYFASEDTVIGGNNYKVLNGFHFNRNAYLREDTVSRKLYYRQKKGFRANQDILIYDFSLQVGDSMLLFNPNTPAADSVGYFTLDSIVIATIKSGTAKMFYLSGKNGRAEWIEGVGSTFMINSGGAVGNVKNGGELTCFFQGKQHMYESKLSSEFNSCFIATVGINDKSDESYFEVFPNPVNDLVHINSNNSLDQLQLYSSIGELMLEKYLKNKHEVINVSFLESGLYVLFIEDVNKHRSRITLLKK